MDEDLAQKYEFGEFQLDMAESVLRRRNEIVPVTPKAIQALELLVQSGGRVLSRSEMIEKLWPDSFVEESNLTVTISMLRRVLGDNDNGAAFIETIAKRGYRFIPLVNKSRPRQSNHDNFGAMEIVRLTNDGRVLDVCISANGRLLAFVPVEAGKHSLWIRDLESGKSWELLPPTSALCWGVQFTLDGESIFYITTPPSSTISELYRVSRHGGHSSKLVVNIDSPISFSPDGTQIVFVRSFPGQRKDSLIVANVDGSTEVELAVREHPSKFSFGSAAWSPDGKLIAVGASRNNDLEFSVLGVPTDGDAVFELSRWQWRDLHAVAWNKEGNALYCSAMATNSNSLQIWRLLYPGGEVQRVTNDPNNYEELSVATHSSAMVTMQIDALANIWIVPTSGSPRRITSGRTEGYYGLAVTGDRIIYASTQNQQSDLWSVNIDGSCPRRLTHKTGLFPSVSRDGCLVCYVSGEGSNLHIWLMDAEGKNERQLTEGEGESYPCISPDGKWVVYSPRGAARNTLWKISTTGGRPVQLTYDGLAIKPVVSPDGNMIACTYRVKETDGWKIVVLSSDNGKLLQSFALPYPFNQIVRWTPNGDALNYLERNNGVYNIWRQRLDGTAPIQITNFTEDAVFSYDWLPEGPLVVSRGEKTRDIVLIRNFE